MDIYQLLFSQAFQGGSSESSNDVISVNGKKGNVVLDQSDLGLPYVSTVSNNEGIKYIRLLTLDYVSTTQGNGIFLVSGGTNIGSQKMALHMIRLSTRNFETPAVDLSMAHITNLGEIPMQFYLIPSKGKVELWVETEPYGYDLNIQAVAKCRGYTIGINGKSTTLPDNALPLPLVDTVSSDIEAIQRSVINNSNAISAMRSDLEKIVGNISSELTDTQGDLEAKLDEVNGEDI